MGTVILIGPSPTTYNPYRQQDVQFWKAVLSLCWYTFSNPLTHPGLQNKLWNFAEQDLIFIVNHRRSPITTYHSYSISNWFWTEKMLEVLGGFSVKSRLGDGSEKRGWTHSIEGEKSRVCGVREWPEKEGKWNDISVQVVIILCT